MQKNTQHAVRVLLHTAATLRAVRAACTRYALHSILRQPSLQPVGRRLYAEKHPHRLADRGYFARARVYIAIPRATIPRNHPIRLPFFSLFSATGAAYPAPPERMRTRGT